MSWFDIEDHDRTRCERVHVRTWLSRPRWPRFGRVINFFKGASLPDPHRLFNSGLEAKTSRSIDLHEGDAMNASHLKALVRAAVAQQ